MKQSQITLAHLLTYSGTLPLIGSALCLFFPVNGVDHELIAKTYAAIIISFLCGIHWAVSLFFADKCPRNLLISSNVVALLAWGSLLVTPQDLATALQILCFLSLLMLDLTLRHAEILPPWFFHLRRNATIIVVFCLGFIAWLS